MEALKHPERRLRHLISIPIIWLPLIPAIILDIIGEIYHRICFPLYGIPYVKRSDYIVFDRHKLKYLRFSNKIGCLYCSYMNGFINYARVIAGLTEIYWCGIKHRSKPGFHEPEHQKNFVPYGDEGAFRKRYQPTLK